MIADAKKIKGAALKKAVAYILDASEVNANDTLAEKPHVYCPLANDFVPMETPAHWEAMALSSISVWLCEPSTLPAARRWFERRGVAY